MLCLALLLICGCSGGQNPDQAEAGKGPMLVAWHWMADREEAFQELSARYEQETGVKVDFQLFAPSDAYGSKVIAAAQTNSLPDIYGILAEPRDYASFIKAGYVEEFTPYMEENNGEWKDKFFPQALVVDTFTEGNQFGIKPGIYGVPIDVATTLFFYNKKLFAQAGIKSGPPRSFEEFIAAGRKLKDSNIYGFVSGWGEVWMITRLADNFAWNIMGGDKVLATVKGDVAYTDPDWIRVFSLFQEMGDSGMLASGIVTMANKYAEQNFANQRAAMAFNGSWSVNVYKGMNPDMDLGVFLPPRVSPDNEVKCWGGPGSSFKVNAKSPKKGEAVKFLKWLTEEKQQAFLAEKTLNLPANRHCLTHLPPIMKEFAVALKHAVHQNQMPVSEYPAVVEAMGKGVQLIILGQKTPEQLGQELEAIKRQEKKRNRRR